MTVPYKAHDGDDDNDCDDNDEHLWCLEIQLIFQIKNSI
jgi:hypothetical protein